MRDGGTPPVVGSSARSFALMSGPGCAARDAEPGAGLGVGRKVTARCGPALFVDELPATGPGAPTPFGPGLGATPADFACDGPEVGPGLGTPAVLAGEADAIGPGGAGLAGADVDRAIVEGLFGAVVAAGTELAAAFGAALGCGLALGAADETAVAAGDGTEVGGTLIVTATVAAVGTEIGTAGISGAGDGSTTCCVGCGFGCFEDCGTGRGLGGALGESFANSWRFCG